MDDGGGELIINSYHKIIKHDDEMPHEIIGNDYVVA